MMLGCNDVIQLYFFKRVLMANTVAYALYYIRCYGLEVVWIILSYSLKLTQYCHSIYEPVVKTWSVCMTTFFRSK